MSAFASARLIEGDVRAVLATLPEKSVQCVITSPPYFGLRSYLDNGHAAKAHELGSEPTLDAYLAALVAVFGAMKRVLRDDGTCWVNIGDSYNANQGAGFDTNGDGGARKAANATLRTFRSKAKDLMLVPFRLALALQADGWYVRQTIIWAKPNPMPESVTDRCTTAHEYIFMLAKQPRYFYDADAVREPNAPNGRSEHPPGAMRPHTPKDPLPGERRNGVTGTLYGVGGRNLRSVWSIATEPFSAARLDAGYVAAPDAPVDHFAAFPTKLVEPCLLAGTSAHGACAVCGAPWVRVSDSHIEYTQAIHNGTKYGGEGQYQNAAANRHRDGHVPGRKVTETTGWAPTCACATDAVQPCVVLDPFVGSGTTCLVALRHGRHAIGVDLSAAYLDLARRRIVADSPMFNRVTVERLATDAPVATAAG